MSAGWTKGRIRQDKLRNHDSRYRLAAAPESHPDALAASLHHHCTRLVTPSNEPHPRPPERSGD